MIAGLLLRPRFFDIIISMRKILLLTAFVCLPVTACFAETTIKAELNKNEIAADEAVTYTVTIATSELRVPPPVFPDLKAFRVISRSQSSSIKVSGNGMKSMVVFVFILLPREPGIFSIPAAAVTAGGARVVSEAFTLTVKAGTSHGPAIPPLMSPPRQFPDLGGEPQYEI